MLVAGLVIAQAPPAPPETLPLGYQPLQGQGERRLAKLAGWRSPEHFWAVFDRVDLIGWFPGPKDRKDCHNVKKGYSKHNHDGHKFPTHLAKLAAGRLLNFGGPLGGGTSLRDYAVVILCGRKVAAAFGLKPRASVPWAEESGHVRFLIMPHPSGVSHFWNDGVSRHRAAAALRAALEVAGLRPPNSLESCSRLAVQRAGLKPAPKNRRLWKRGALISELQDAESEVKKRKTLAAAAAHRQACAVARLGTPSEPSILTEALAYPESTGPCAPKLPEGAIHSRFFSNHAGGEY